MNKVIVFAIVRPAAGKANDLHEAVRFLVAAAEEEPGLEVYAAHAADDGAVWFYEIYESAAAWDVHGRGERMRTAMSRLGDLIDGPAEIQEVTPLAVKGINLAG